MINSQHNKYYIMYDNNILVDGFHPTGMPIFSAKPQMSFDTYESARSFLSTQLQYLLTTTPDRVVPEELSKYEVVHMICTYQRMGTFDNSVTQSWFRNFGTEKGYKEDTAGYQAARSLMKYVVLNGWSSVSLPKDSILDILNDPKYSNIVENTVPPHMIENFDLFWDCGIKTCNPDELGAIMLTSTDKILGFLDVDIYNVSR